MTTATIRTTNYNVHLSNGRHDFLSDEPADLGGEDSGPAPDELFEAALGSCTAITLRMYANPKQWKVEEINVVVTLERIDNKTIFTREITVKGDIDEEQRTRLLQIAKACPVSKTLHGEIEVNSKINPWPKAS